MILLTGATGFLGNYVLDALLQQGYDVIALFHTDNKIIDHYPRVKWIRTDLSKTREIERLPVPKEGIIHLASSLSTKPRTVMKVDISAMWGLLNKWDEGPFILISSTDVYGRLNTIPADEEHPLAPQNWYGLGKMFCEDQLQMTARMKGRFDFAIFRPPYILGSAKIFSQSMVGRLIHRAMDGDDFVLPEGQAWNSNYGHSWVDAHDLACWIVLALRNEKSGIYNATNGYSTWEHFLNLILRLTNSPGNILFQAGGDKNLGLCFEERNFSNERIMRTFEIKDHSRLEQTLAKIIDYIKRRDPF